MGKKHWRDDEEYGHCGHPQVVCKTARGCAFQRIDKIEDEGGGSPASRRRREELHLKLMGYGTTYENSMKKYVIHLVCGHTTLQKTTNFAITDDMYCYKCAAWFKITHHISPTGYITHNPTISERTH